MSDSRRYDRIIIGAGLYGMYAARLCGARGEKVLVLEYDPQPFMRATTVNQARVHMGYHYPRSLTTACKSAGYYRRFHEDFPFAIFDSFEQIYATSAQFSWTDAAEFRSFCKAAGIRCDEVAAGRFFRPGMCDGAFLTEEDTYDAAALRDYFVDETGRMPNVEIVFGARLSVILQGSTEYTLRYSVAGDAEPERVYEAASPFVLNAGYASVNQILSRVHTGERGDADDNFSRFAIKYELCEIILCKASDNLKKYGITVMDGPFFSIMPFGLTGLHSLTSVTFTPHATCPDSPPVFACQEGTDCSPEQLGNCTECPHRPVSAWPYMSHLADKYLRPEYSYGYTGSLYSMKPILRSSEVDDSRPTAIRVNSRKPGFVSVLSGKIDTVYDLDEFLQ
ncbi:MAG: NAD(P)-binding protein [Lachnospiraceae bacterium]|nr:NAD(P)-binding protein [Lachnospiraceae bacterium]